MNGLHYLYNLNSMTSIKVIPKKRGRPATGKDPLVAFRAPETLISALDEYGAKSGMARSEAIRAILTAWLAENSNVAG